MADYLRKAPRRRLTDWRRVSGYAKRPVVAKGDSLDAVRYRVPASPSLRGRVVAFFTDLHWDGPSRLAEELAEFIDRLAPDWLVYGGDLVSEACHFDSAIDFLTTLTTSRSKLAVIGNWDRLRTRWFPISAWRDAYERAGFQLLINDSLISDEVFFHGVDDCKLGSPENPGRFPDDAKFACLITHNPDWAVDGGEEALSRFNLILAGHTHGGQVRLPGFGAIETSSKYWKKFEYGLYQRQSDGARMIVSSGIGMSAVPFRFCCRPELVLVEFTE